MTEESQIPYTDECAVCATTSDRCCGEYPWCCNRSDEHKHYTSAWDLLGIAPDWTGGKNVDEWINDQRDRSAEV